MKRIRLRKLCVLSLLCCAANASDAQAQQLDQSHVVPANPRQARAYGTSSYTETAQTLTVGLEGWLSKVEVAIYRPAIDFDGFITVDISRVTNGVPDFSESGVLARRIVSNATVPTLSVHDSFISQFTLQADFVRSRLNVYPGDKLALILRPTTSGPEYYNWWANIESGPAYANGGFFQRDMVSGIINNAGGTQFDAQFRTFVMSIPEPTFSSSIASSLFIFGCARIRRRK